MAGRRCVGCPSAVAGHPVGTSSVPAVCPPTGCAGLRRRSSRPARADASEFSIPSKALSYLCAGRPVLGLMPTSNAAAGLIARAGNLVLPPHEDSIGEAARWVVNLSADPERAQAIGHAPARLPRASSLLGQSPPGSRLSCSRRIWDCRCGPVSRPTMFWRTRRLDQNKWAIIITEVLWHRASGLPAVSRSSWYV